MTSDRRITWSLATLFRNGSYNSTFTFDVIQPAFDLICRYFQLSMPRVSFWSRFMDLVHPTYAMTEQS